MNAQLVSMNNGLVSICKGMFFDSGGKEANYGSDEQFTLTIFPEKSSMLTSLTFYEFDLNDDDFLYEHWIMYFTYNREEANSYAKYLLNKKFTTKNILNNTLTFDEIKNYVSSLQKTVKYWFYLHNPAFSPYSDETKEWLQKLNRLKMGAFSPLLISVLSQHNEEDIYKT